MKLRELFESMSPADREALASKAALNSTYLWQIATRWKGKRPSLEAIQRLVSADERLTLSELIEEFSSSPQTFRQTDAAAKAEGAR